MTFLEGHITTGSGDPQQPEEGHGRGRVRNHRVGASVSWLAVRRLGVAVLLVLAGTGACQLVGDTRPSTRRQRANDPAGPRAGMETAAGPIASAAALEPDIQVAPNALGCREASLTGQHLSAPQLLGGDGVGRDRGGCASKGSRPTESRDAPGSRLEGAEAAQMTWATRAPRVWASWPSSLRTSMRFVPSTTPWRSSQACSISPNVRLCRSSSFCRSSTSSRSRRL